MSAMTHVDRKVRESVLNDYIIVNIKTNYGWRTELIHRDEFKNTTLVTSTLAHLNPRIVSNARKGLRDDELYDYAPGEGCCILGAIGKSADMDIANWPSFLSSDIKKLSQKWPADPSESKGDITVYIDWWDRPEPISRAQLKTQLEL